MDNLAKIEMDKFFGSLRTSAEGYRYLLFRYFAMETADGLQLICATLGLELFAEDRGKRWHFPSGRTAAGCTQQRINFAAVKDLAEKFLATGELQIDGRTFRLAKEDGDRFSAFFRPFAAFPLPQGLKAPTLRISGGRRQPLFFDAAELDFELKAAEQPYHALGELLHVAGLPTQIPDQVWVDFYATVVVMVDDAKSCMKGTTAEIALLAPNTLNIDAVRLGWRCLQDNAVYDRLSIDAKRIRSTKEGEQLHGVHKLEVQSRSVIQCFVSDHGCLQHEWWIAESSVIYNPRRAAHEAFDPKLERLEQRLFDRKYLKDDSRKFEEGVTYLLSMLGFRATRYHKPLADAPEIIASTAKGDFAETENGQLQGSEKAKFCL